MLRKTSMERFLIDGNTLCKTTQYSRKKNNTRGRQFHIWTHYNSAGECNSTARDHLHVLVRGPHLSTRGEKQKPSQTPFHAFCRGSLAGSNLGKPCVVGQNIWSMEGMLTYLRKGSRKYFSGTDSTIPALQPLCLTKDEKDQIEREGFKAVRGPVTRVASLYGACSSAPAPGRPSWTESCTKLLGSSTHGLDPRIWQV